jgi:ubiquinol-cytochrome c reductase cytochrome b subunit
MSAHIPHPAGPGTPDPAPERGLRNWIEQRTGINGLLKGALDEPIPGGARYAYIFGSGLLFIFLSQVITGIFLALYYVPSADHAHTTVAYIAKEVAAGSFLRSLHVYGSSAMVIVVLLHVSQTFLYGSYKGRRELLWLSGTVLFALVLGMAFTGYLLPWDERAYFATAVGTNVPSEIPLVGNAIKELMRGGSELGTLTISRFFVAHVFMIPGLIFLLISAHVFLLRKAGPAGPPSEDPFHPRLPTQSFYPRQLLMDLSLTLLLIVILGLLAFLYPAELGPEANPADTQFLPRPEWYYRSLFQWLKLWTGRSAVIGIMVVPLIVTVLFVGLPFIDRGVERRPWKRPIAVGLFSLVFGGLILMGAWSFYADAQDPAVAKQLALQDQQMKDYMREPFKPQREPAPSPPAGPASVAASSSVLSGAGSGASTPDPAVAAGQKIFESHACNACHGPGGAGTPMAPKLSGIGKKYSPEQLLNLFNHPTAAMDKGGMPHFQFTQDDVKALIAYLGSQP